MAKKNRNTLKGFFETGKNPTEGQYANLIDSFVTLSDENTGSLNIKGNTVLDGHLTASGGITASGTLVIGGEISASGGISSSGTIEAQQFVGDGRFLTNITSSVISTTGVTASFTSGAPTGSLIVSGNLFHPSASTNILMAIKTTGSIIPADTSNYDLGSPTNFWKSLFVSNSFATTYTGIFNGALSGSTLSSAAQGTAVLNTNGVAGSTIDLGLQTTDSVLFASITSSGDITASSGIKANVIEVSGGEDSGYRFNNDPDTVIYQESSNAITFKAGDADTFTISATGIENIGNSILGNAASDTHTITGNITASGNISASGTIFANNFQSAGGDVGGISFTDELNLTGNLTASGNISSSGTITANEANILGHITASSNISSSGTIIANEANILGHITASNNISASGNVTANSFIGTFVGAISSSTQIAAGISSSFVVNSATGSFILASQTSSFTLNSQSGSFVLNSQTGSLSNLTVTGSGNNRVSITTSGNITASAGVNASGTSSLGMLIVNQNITASGNISASGNLIAGEANILGHITASNNISASGTVTGLTASFAIIKTLTASISHLIGGSPLTFGGTDAFQFSSDINLGVTASGGDAKLLTANDISLIDPIIDGTFTTGVAGSGRTQFGGAHEVELYGLGATKILNVSGSGDSTLIGSYMLMGSASLPGGNAVGNTDMHTIKFGSGSSHHPTTGDFYGGTDTITFNTKVGNISASGNVTALTGSFDNISTSAQVDGFVSAMGIGTPSNITSDVNIPANINALQFTNNTGNLTIPAGINYTIGIGSTTSTPFLLDAIGGGAYMTGSLKLKGSISASGLIQATSASFGNLGVSAFGDISSSGNITASGDLEIKNITSSGTSTLGGTVYISGSVYSGSGTNVQSAGSQGGALVALVITGSVIPEGNNKWSLGSPTNFFKDLYVSEESIRFVSSSGEVTPLKQENVKNLIEGKPVKQASALAGTDVFVRTQALFHETNDSSFIKTTVAGLWAYEGPGGAILDIDARGENHVIDIKSAASQLNLAGTLSASLTTATHIIGGITTFGNSTITINGLAGHITASGNISASGNITTTNLSASNDLRVDGTGSFSSLIIEGASGLNILSGAITGSIISGSTIIATTLTGSLSGNATGLSGTPSITVNQITASATISSSGNIFANNLTIANTSSLANISITGNVSSSGTISAVSMSGDGSGITGVTAEWDGSRSGNAEITGSLIIVGGITASVGISSSTIITTGGVTLGNGSTDRHLITGNITSSGNLSSSGTITALTGSFGSLNINNFGNITSSGTISASGNITANSFTGIFVGAISSSTQIAADISSSFVTNSATSSLILASQTSSFVLNSQSSSFVLNSQTGSLSNLTVTGSGNNKVSITTLGNITASAGINASGTSSLGMLIVTQNITASNISASGTLTAGTLTAGTTTVGALTATTLNTGQGANELYDMDQNVKTTSNVKFGIVRTTNNLINSGSTALGNASADIHTIIGNVTSSGNISSSGTITAATLSVATFTPTNLNTGDITGSNISASGFLSASNIHTVGDITLLGNISGSGTTSLTIGGNTILSQITASGILSSSNNIIASQITASTFSGDGSGLTNITAEWDGTINGNAQITGSLILSGSGDTNLNVLGDISGSSISASGTVYAQDIVSSTSVVGVGFTNPTTISSNTTIPAGHNSVMFITQYNPSITVSAGVEYTVSLGADTNILQLNPSFF